MVSFVVSVLLCSFALTLTGCATSPLGRKQLILVPDSQMNALGVQAFQQMKAQTPTASDPLVNQYVTCVAKPITAAAQKDTGISDWEIVVFRDETANAFALPGGKIGVHTGLLKVATTADQLAAVIGHEVGHVIAKHGAERVSSGVAAQGGLAVLDQALGGAPSSGRQQLLAGLVTVGFLLPHSRTQESEADLIGLKLMARAGFDPRHSIKLWENMRAASGGASPPEFFSTHPANESRIENLQNKVSEALPFYEQTKKTGSLPNCRL
ncbi:MAG: peptidase [Bdellovibrionales bacterium GWB1_52_6]|nr:MAG: peptidase [Bdellovibrionales bacterium GWB1_52_6]OFZ04189.1 MAG: peptidase [Bdellovibrionales bacterium GWA1_52_35]